MPDHAIAISPNLDKTAFRDQDGDVKSITALEKWPVVKFAYNLQAASY
jgi:hypothetical protein